MRLRPRVNRPDKPVAGRVPAAAPSDRDTILNAILKWIPIEVIGSYLFVLGLIPTAENGFRFSLSGVFCVLTPLWIGFATRSDAAERVAWRQVILATVAFIFWTLGTQDWIGERLFGHWEAWMGSVVLGVGAVILPIGDGVLKVAGVRQQPQ